MGLRCALLSQNRSLSRTKSQSRLIFSFFGVEQRRVEYCSGLLRILLKDVHDARTQKKTRYFASLHTVRQKKKYFVCCGEKVCV